MKKLIIVSVLAISIMACCTKKNGSTTAKAESGESGKNVPGTVVQDLETANFKVLEQSTHGGREVADNIIIKDHQELYNLYKELNLGIVPKVDFNKEQVVAMFMGQQSSGGYDIGVEKVAINNGRTEVVIKETYPAKDEMVTSALTAPYCIAVIPKAKEVVFLQDPPPMMED